MDTRNRKIMQLPKDLLSEVNYEGTRLIEITDETVLALLQEVKKCGEEVKPFLDEMDKYTPEIDKLYAELRPIEEKRAELKEKLTVALKPFQVEQEKADMVYQKSDAIKQKIYPLARELVNPQLSEFESAGQFIERDGKTFIEITDEIEEKIKQIRAKNASSK